MRQEDFLVTLQETLIGNVPEHVIQENVMYYRNYINKQMQNGKSEDAILESLGNPRLLAKTIIDTSQFAAEYEEKSGQENWRQDYSGQSQWTKQEQMQKEATHQKYVKSLRLPGWFAGIVCVVIMALLIGLAFCVVSYLAPILLTVGFGILAYRVIKKLFRGY